MAAASSSQRLPAVAFGLQAVALGIGLYLTGRWRPEVVPDTASYTDFVWWPLSAALSQIRTAGYPCFLAAGRLLGVDWAAVPPAQYLIHVFAVWAFWHALRKWFDAPWPALACASTLLYANLVWRYVRVVAADCLAASLAILCVSALLVLIRDAKRRSLWIAVALLTFATYQVRPAYLFLVPLVPVLGGLLAAWDRLGGGTARASWTLLGRLGTASFAPLLVFCLVRWLVVGHIGLVAFTGYNFAGVVGQFLAEDAAQGLPTDVAPLAHRALEYRRELAARDDTFSAAITRSYATIESRFDASTWQVFARAAADVYHGEPLEMNEGLTRLGLATIRLRPADYAVWLVKAFFRGVYMIGSELVVNPVYLALLALLGVCHGRYVGHWLQQDLRPLSADRPHVLRLNTLLLIAIAFSLSKVMLVILTTPPLGRFMDAAGIFWPPLIAAMLAHRVAATRELLADRKRKPHEGTG